MTSAERRRKDMVEADSEQALLDVVQQFVDAGVHDEHLLKDLDQIRTLVGEAQEEWVLNVMDRMVGWCAPDARIRRSGADH